MVLTRKGFTLVELLIAAAMISVLFVGLGAHLRGGITLWLRSTQTVEGLQRQRVALDRLERDLANAVVYGGALPVLESDGKRMVWATIEPAGREQPARLRIVAYECAERGGVQGLWRGSQTASEALAQAEASPVLLLPQCEALTFRYAYQPAAPSEPLVWEGSWGQTDHLPKLIEITLMRSGRTVSRTVEIPSGVLEPLEPPAP